MKHGLLAMLFLAASIQTPAQAQWQFQPAEELSPARPGVFHHLDGSGRANLAVTAGQIAVVWEDNRGGASRCYLGIKPRSGTGLREFAFGQGECFEPAVAALDPQRLLVIWEDAGGVAAALAGPDGVGGATRLAAQGGHGSIVHSPRFGIEAAWSASDGRWRRVWHSHLSLDGATLAAAPAQPVDASPPGDDQTYPVLAASPATLALAWEDRRNGHTVIYFSHSEDGRAWSVPARLSQNPTGKAQGYLGRGTGAMRPALAAFGDRMAAVWLDKRDFLSGYDVYAAISADGGASFATNAKAQDSFGDAIAQWHATVAGNARGDLAIAWDDDRDGSADIWLTWPKPGGGYADNIAPPPAAGPAHQSDPAIALDEAGRLHLVWLERGDGGVTRLMYTIGTPETGN